MWRCYIRNKQSFDNIEVGIKIFEGRLYHGVWEKVQVGDNIIFEHDNLKCSRIIKKLTLYNTITDVCKHRQIPEYKDIFDSCYSQNRQEKYKVVILDI